MELAASLGIPILLGGTDTSYSARYKCKWTLRKVNGHVSTHLCACVHVYTTRVCVYSSTQTECVCAGVFLPAGP